MASLLIDDFSGGLNLRDSPNQLRPNETPLADNFTLDERGALKCRNGCANVVALPGTTGTKAYIFFSEALNLWLCARESASAFKLFTRPADLSGSWTDRGQIASAVTAQAVFADWPGTTPYAIILTDVADATNGGLYTLDSTPTLTKRFATDAKAIAVWQNKVWIGGASVAPTRIYFSPPGDPTTWTSSIDLRDKDASAITAMGLAGGGLIVFKKRSTYRVNDSGTGAYTMIDGAVGCVNPRALATLRGRLYTWAADGMYECDGVGALKNVGDKLRPIYVDASTAANTIVAGIHQDRAVFAGTLQGLQRLIEFDPDAGWSMRHRLASASQDLLTSFAHKDGTLYGAIADGDDLFRMFTETPGADDGTLHGGDWLSCWLLPNAGMLARLHRLRVQGLLGVGTSTTLDLRVYKNWDLSTTEEYSIGTQLRAADSGDQQLAVDLQSLGHASSFAVRFLPAGAAGAVAIRALQLIDQSLAWPSPGYPKVQTRDRSYEGRRGGGGVPMPIGNDRGPR